MKKQDFNLEEFYAFQYKKMWAFFKQEHFSFWMICGYLAFEIFRPQAIFPQLDILPFARLFLIGSLIGAIADPSVKWASIPTNKWMILFFVWINLSCVTAYNSGVAYSNLLVFYSIALEYFLITFIANTEKRLYILVIIFMAAAGKIAVGTSKTWAMRGFSFTDWGLMGPKGPFQNSGELAVLMVVLFPLAYYLFTFFKNSQIKIWERCITIILWTAPILTILGASSRGSQLALIAQLALMFRKSLLRVKSLIGVAILVTGIVMLLPQEQKDRFSSSGDDRTSQQRLMYWKHGYSMILENPILGVGFYNFATYYDDHYSYDLLYPHAQLPHNIVVQIGTDAGIPAIFFFLMMLLFCLRTPFRCLYISPSCRHIGYGLGMGIFGFFLAGQFVTITYYPFFWINFALISALYNINQNNKKNDMELKINHRNNIRSQST